MENKIKIFWFLHLTFTTLILPEAIRADKPLFQLKMLSLSAGQWASTTSRSYETVYENFNSLPKIGALVGIGRSHLYCEGGTQWVFRDDGFQKNSAFSGSDLSCLLLAGNRWKSSLGFSLPLYKAGTPPTDPYLGTGNIFAKLGISTHWSLMGNSFLSQSSFNIHTNANIALNESLAKPGSFTSNSSVKLQLPVSSKIKAGLSLAYGMEYWNWTAPGAGKETNHNLTGSLPLRIRISKNHTFQLHGGWLLWNKNQRTASGRSFSPDINGFYYGAGWEYWI